MPFLTLSPFPLPFSVICDPRRRPVPLAVECVQYVDLLLCATAKSSPPAAAHCGRQRRSGPFNNPLSHFCVSEEGRERDDCRAPSGRWRERPRGIPPSLGMGGSGGDALSAVLKTGVDLGVRVEYENEYNSTLLFFRFWNPIQNRDDTYWVCLKIQEQNFTFL